MEVTRLDAAGVQHPEEQGGVSPCARAAERRARARHPERAAQARHGRHQPPEQPARGLPVLPGDDIV